MSTSFRMNRAGLRRTIGAAALGLAMLGTAPQGLAQLVFNLNPAVGTSAQAIQGFQDAADRWSAIYNDNVTVNINIGFTALGAGILGQAGSNFQSYSFTQVKTALGLDAISADDATAVANLQGGTNMSLLINGTTEVGGNPGSSFIDTTGANTSTVRMTNANAKALGLLAGNAATLDASITFSTAFNWDFDPTDGILPGYFDFVGVAAHEIGHAMGFTSGVDVLDNNMIGGGNPFTFHSDAFVFVSTLDLFRYSASSYANGALDWTADARAKYFSIDGGATVGAGFSTGRFHGDGRQASHWKDNLGLGILDPTSAPGELLAISANDIQGFDVIGWNKQAAQVPDAGGTAVLLVLGAVALVARRRLAA